MVEVDLVIYHNKYEECGVLSVILSIETHSEIVAPLKSIGTIPIDFSADAVFLKDLKC